LTSDGQRHRPVHRGKWILETILNRPPPPPPANVDPIEPTPPEQPKLTLRAKLALHTTNESCAACHRKIDPLGMAFDHFDAIGQYRTVELTTDGSGENPIVDASGQLADGRRFRDSGELKKLLLDDIDQFNSAFIEKLATYALRRTMTFDDRTELKKIAEQSQRADYRLRDLMEILLQSELFQRR
jgi:hypothetical protein